MGKALILEALGSGHYRIQYTFETRLIDQRITELTLSIKNMDEVEIPAQEAIIVSAEASQAEADHNLNIAIATGIYEDIQTANAALIQSTDYLTKQERELSLLKMLRLNLVKTKDFAIANRPSPIEVKAWCADFSSDIIGEVGTIEIVSNRYHPVLIRPAGIEGNEATYENKDGIMATPGSLNEFGWLYNTMMQPGGQKWLSRYRIGTILEFQTQDPNICNVRFDAAEGSNPTQNINQEERAYNLPIKYLECNGEAFKLGDRVIVEHEEKKGINGERGIYRPKRVIGFESHPRPCGLTFVIWSGSDTIDYNRKYYLLRRGELSVRNNLDGWNLTDDGKYSIIWGGVGHLDPNDFSYRRVPSEGDGLRVPETDTGRDTKKQEGLNVRFMTNQAVEDETWIAFEIDTGSFVYSYLGVDDSLTRTPYKIKSKASVCRYTKKGEAYNDYGLLTFNRILEAGSGILLTKAWHTNSFGSSIPIIDRGYTTRFDSTREYIDLAAEEPEASAIVCTVGESEDYTGIERLIRGEAFSIGIAELAEPLTKQEYNFRDKDVEGFGFIGDIGNYYRSWDEATHDVYMIDANTIYGKVVDSNGFTTTSGQQYINNDITLPYGVTDSDKLTYVRKQKDTEFTMANVGLYVADILVEESDFQSVLSLWGDGDLPAEHNAPIQIRYSDYHPLQVHHGNFDVVVFRRVVYKSYGTELLPYKILRTISASHYFHAQVRRTLVTSEIQYAISVNGKVTDLPYKTTVRESRLSVLSEEYIGGALPLLSGYAFGPWMDVGFNKDGLPTGEDNNQLTRIFVSESGGNVFVGFDLFPVEARHDITVTNDILHPEFDDISLNFPPYIDLEYIVPKGRRWLIFDSSGSVVEDITPPSENRINGVSILDPRG